MKTDNLQPSGRKAGAAAEGYTNTNRAEQGLRVIDGSGNDVYPVTTLRVPWVQDLTEDEAEIGSESAKVWTNASGVTLNVGDVVVLSGTTVVLTTTAQDTRPVGVVTVAGISGGEVIVQTSGRVDLVNVTASVTANYYAETSTIAAQATESATRRTGSFGVFLTSGTAPAALLFGIPDATSGGGGGGAGYPWRSVLDYAATGDGTTDDTAAIAAAIAACAEYETLYFPVGIYRITSTLTIAKAIRLLGASAYPNPDTSPDGATIIRMATNDTTAISQSAVKRLGIEHMVIDNAGTAASGSGVYALGSVAMHHALIRDFYDNLYINGTTGGSYVTAIDESFFHNAGRANIYLEGKVNNFRMRGGYISTGPYGIYATGGIYTAHISDLAVESYTTAGIYIDGLAVSRITDTISLTRLYMDTIVGSAPDIWLGDTNPIQNVTLEDIYTEAGGAGMTHVRIDNADRVTIIGGHIRSNAGGSVSIDAAGATNVLLVNVKCDGTTSFPATTVDLTPTAVPGGELGGTWASPTVDATHSGSAHTDFIAKAIVDAKGDLIAATAADTVARVAVGTNGLFLKADSGAAAGVSWAAPAGGGGGPSAIAYSSGDVTVTGSLADITGCSVSLAAGTYIVTGVFDVLVNSALNDRVFEGHLDSGGVDQTNYGDLVAPGLVNVRAMITQSWRLVLASTTTVKLRARYSGGTAGDFTVKAQTVIAAFGAGTSVPTDGIWDAAGDLAVGTGADTAARLAIGAAGGALSRVNGAVAWNSGTSFPTAATGDRYWRTDLGLEFYYDGTRWLSTGLYQIQVLGSDPIQPYAASGGQTRAATPVWAGSDIYLVSTWTSFFVSGGTALSASHKWVGTLAKQPAGTTLDTINIASGASSAWRQSTLVAINALLTLTNFELDVFWAKTGTPGNLFTETAISFRYVAV